MSQTDDGASPVTRHWVLLRGLSRDSRHWEDLPTLLQSAFPQDQITSLDLAGTGSRNLETCPVSIDAMVDDLRVHYQQQLAGTEPQRLTLLSISMGGMIAADWASRFGEEIESVVIINSSSRLSPWWQRMRPAAMISLLSSLCLGARRREQRIVRYTSNRSEHYESVAKRWLNYHAQAPAKLTTILKQLTAATRFIPPPALKVPALVIKADQDRLVNSRCSDALAARWKVKLLQHPDAGHDIPLDDPLWLIEQLQSWCTERP